MLQKGGQGKMIARALRWVLGALCVLLLPSLAAQSPLPVSPPTARTSAAQKTPMWEVRVKGELGAVVYLLGSVHVCRATCYPLPQNLLQRFDSARVLAVELDPRRQDMQEKIMAVASLPNNQTINELLSPADRELLAAVLSQMGVPSEAVARFQPWMLATMVTLLSAQREGYRTEQGVDLWASSRAVRQGKRIVELETIERQIAALTAGTMDENIAGLRYALNTVKNRELAPYLDQLIKAWREGNAQRLNELMDEGAPADSDWRENLMDARNREMLLKVEGFLKRKERTVVVVGAGHLAGETGLPTLLMKAGYQVRQLGPLD